MIKFAIVGNIASGKSQVENILKDMGYKVYDADKIAHDILSDSSEVLASFADFDILENGVISRKKLGNIVFNNEELRNKLNDIIHPKVKDRIKQIFENDINEKYIFISVPLLFEANMQELFDKIIFIYSDDNIRLERLMKRNNISKEAALARMNSQIPQDDKFTKADYVIKNESSIENLKSQILDII